MSCGQGGPLFHWDCVAGDPILSCGVVQSSMDGSPEPDWSAIRSQFPALSNWTYLNTATFGQLPRCATEAVTRHWAHRDETACGDFLGWFDDADRLRASLAQLINATADDIAFTPSAAHVLSFILNGLELKDGDNIVTLRGDFPNQLYLPQLREVEWERFYDSIDARTRMVAISEVNYATGFRPPLAEISRFLRERDVLFFLDGTQSAGALKIDLRATPLDVYAVHAYKWMISPNGAGFFYIAPDVRARFRPSVIGWRSHHDWRNVDNLHHGIPVFSSLAEKYEGGGLPSALLYAMEASVGMLLSMGPEVIERRVLGLAGETRSRMRALGAVVEGDGSQIVAARFRSHDASKLARELKQRHVLVAARHGYLRISPHFYNNEEDLERLEEGLRKTL
jgi:cysteine desulfurase / selenocysteine lyase